jgi:hypothetical protein
MVDEDFKRRTMKLEELGRMGWDEAMYARIPKNPSEDLLRKAMADVHKFIDFYIDDLSGPDVSCGGDLTREDSLRALVFEASMRLYELGVAYFKVREQRVQTDMGNLNS